jgi:hypothetical protein
VPPCRRRFAQPDKARPGTSTKIAPNPRLRDLQAKCEAKGGHAYVGDDAWAHLEEEAGGITATFIERYVRAPIFEISAFEVKVGGGAERKRLRLLDLETRMIEGDIVFKIGSYERFIARVEDETLVDDGSASNDE